MCIRDRLKAVATTTPAFFKTAPTWCSYLVDGLPTKRTWFSSSSWIFFRHSTLRHFRTDPTCKTTNFSDSTLYRVRSSPFSAIDTGRNLLRSTPLYTNGSTSQPSRRYVASASLDWVSTRSVFKNGTAGSRSDEAANQSPCLLYTSPSPRDR